MPAPKKLSSPSKSEPLMGGWGAQVALFYKAPRCSKMGSGLRLWADTLDHLVLLRGRLSSALIEGNYLLQAFLLLFSWPRTFSPSSSASFCVAEALPLL